MKNNFCFIGNNSNIYKKPSKLSEVTSQIICGEKFKILSKNKSWIKIKLLFDNYVGYIQDKKFTQKTNLDYKVYSLKARIFKKPNVGTKSYLTFGSKVSVLDENKNYIKIQKNKWIKKIDVRKLNHKDKNFIKIFKKFLQVKYVWGGKSYKGIDCSALIQLSLETIGVNFPRNTNMQANYYPGLQMDYEKLNRGVLIFWEGHVGVMINENQILHSNGFFMSTIIEDLSKAEKRISINHGNIQKLINNFQII